jgi:2-keto-3-deoxy-L-rhamnonate aldolase RhmA
MLYAQTALAFQERVRSGAICFGVHHSAMSPQLVELYGHIGIDFLIIGMEVESLDYGRMEDLLRAADVTRTLPIVKLRRPSAELVDDVMNAGAAMVMVPHVSTRAQLDAMVRASRFAPEGIRGECPAARYNSFGAGYLPDVRRLTHEVRSIIPIIEDAAALDHLDDLMSSPDVDIFEVGPFDLSASLGEPGLSYDSPKCMAAIERITEAAQKHGKALLAPMRFSLKKGSVRDAIQWNMDELISRGINLLWVAEVGMLVECTLNLSVMRKIRVVDEAEDEETDQPVVQAVAEGGGA